MNKQSEFLKKGFENVNVDDAEKIKNALQTDMRFFKKLDLEHELWKIEMKQTVNKHEKKIKNSALLNLYEKMAWGLWWKEIQTGAVAADIWGYAFEQLETSSIDFDDKIQFNVYQISNKNGKLMASWLEQSGVSVSWQEDSQKNSTTLFPYVSFDDRTGNVEVQIFHDEFAKVIRSDDVETAKKVSVEMLY